jgi:hypothetical protein
MKKNHDLHFLVEKSLKEKLQKEADELMIPLAELCRHKLKNSIPLDKTKFLLEKLIEELKVSAKFGKA